MPYKRHRQTAGPSMPSRPARSTSPEGPVVSPEGVQRVVSATIQLFTLLKKRLAPRSDNDFRSYRKGLVDRASGAVVASVAIALRLELAGREFGREEDGELESQLESWFEWMLQGMQYNTDEEWYRDVMQLADKMLDSLLDLVSLAVDVYQAPPSSPGHSKTQDVNDTLIRSASMVTTAVTKALRDLPVAVVKVTVINIPSDSESETEVDIPRPSNDKGKNVAGSTKSAKAPMVAASTKAESSHHVASSSANPQFGGRDAPYPRHPLSHPLSEPHSRAHRPIATGTSRKRVNFAHRATVKTHSPLGREARLSGSAAQDDQESDSQNSGFWIAGRKVSA